MISQKIIELAFRLASECQAHGVLVCSDMNESTVEMFHELAQVHSMNSHIPVLLTCRNCAPSDSFSKTIISIPIPSHPMTRLGQAKIALLVALARGHLKIGDTVVLLTGIDRSQSIDTIVVVSLKTESELITVSNSLGMPPRLQVGVFEKVLSIAVQISIEGREGRPIGTIFVLGDSERVLNLSRNLILNPFYGYPAHRRNVLNENLSETLKEFATIDGAFVISDEGVIETAGTQLLVTTTVLELEKGLGTRHAAAAAITENTDAVSICVSQSTGGISVFRKGSLMAEILKPSPELRFSGLVGDTSKP